MYQYYFSTGRISNSRTRFFVDCEPCIPPNELIFESQIAVTSMQLCYFFEGFDKLQYMKKNEGLIVASLKRLAHDSIIKGGSIFDVV